MFSNKTHNLPQDPFELSRLRRDDFDTIEPKSTDCDVALTDGPGSRSPQAAAAFLQVASGLRSYESGASFTKVTRLLQYEQIFHRLQSTTIFHSHGYC